MKILISIIEKIAFGCWKTAANLSPWLFFTSGFRSHGMNLVWHKFVILVRKNSSALKNNAKSEVSFLHRVDSSEVKRFCYVTRSSRLDKFSKFSVPAPWQAIPSFFFTLISYHILSRFSILVATFCDT